MTTFLARLFPQTTTEKTDFDETLSRLRSVPEFLEKVGDAVKGTDLPNAMRSTLPWAGVLADSAAEALPPIKFVVALFERIGRIDDPHALGYLACTLAYQRALERTLDVGSLPPGLGGKKRTRRALQLAAPVDGYDFTTFGFDNALNHPFIRDCDDVLAVFAVSLGADADGVRRLEGEVHRRFVPALKEILCHGATRDRFAPFTDLLRLDQMESRVHDALRRHAAYQRYLFEEAPILGDEPYPLCDVFVEMDCWNRRWKEIKRQSARTAPTGEQLRENEPKPERRPLLESVMELVTDPSFNEAILIEGPAGSGKTSFTLRLFLQLERRGFQPIRIELRNVDTREGRPGTETLPEAVEIGPPAGEGERWFRDGDLFRGGRLFDEMVRFDGKPIARHVLILDGWDEISITASLGFQEQVERLLRDVRQDFLEHRNAPVRVILAGRPTEAIERSGFLRPETPVLTLQPLTPEQLRGFVEGLSRTKGPAESPRPPAAKDVATIVTRYESAVRRAAARPPHRYEHAVDAGLEVLGLPLLAFLTLRLVREDPGRAESLFENPTTLYRSLVDLVVGKGGKAPDAQYDVDGKAMLAGNELRDLLRRTAEAMTHLGTENVSREELALRLEIEGEDLDERARKTAREHRLSRLLISFFFKGGNVELGCEFCHKSFREYLFAERIIERLKAYGRQVDRTLPERPRDQYWKDFEEGDPRRRLAHDLTETLGPVWLTPEVGRHVDAILGWDITRAFGQAPAVPTSGSPTEAGDRAAWNRIRDALVDLWDWWGEGVHLRPQPRFEPRRSVVEYDQPLAARIASEDRPRADPRRIVPPPRTTSIDGHLGDALCRIAARTHAVMALREGFVRRRASAPADEESAPQVTTAHRRRYQTVRRADNREWLLFAPSGDDPLYLSFYLHRVNAAGYRPGLFPKGIDLSLAELSGVSLLDADLFGAELIAADLSGSDLLQVDLLRADLTGAKLSSAKLIEAELSETRLIGAELVGTDLSGASLFGANLLRADLRGANLSDADLSNAILVSANLAGATLINADLSGASLIDADLSLTNLSGAHLSGANLFWADLTGADLSDANLDDADVSGTNLLGANLSGASLERVDLAKARNASHICAHMTLQTPDDAS